MQITRVHDRVKMSKELEKLLEHQPRPFQTTGLGYNPKPLDELLDGSEEEDDDEAISYSTFENIDMA